MNVIYHIFQREKQMNFYFTDSYYYFGYYYFNTGLSVEH